MATLTASYQQIASKHIATIAGSGVSTKYLYLRIYAKYTSQSIVDNKSYVSYKSTLYVDGEGTYFYTGNTTTKSLGGTGATTTSGDAQGNYYVGETTLNEITGVVTHNASGEASVSVTAGWVSTPWEVNGSLTATATLPTIARATKPVLSATTITMGSAINVTLTPANSTFKHKLRYDFGSISGSADGFSVGAEFTSQGTTTVTFTPPTSLGSQIPNNLSGTGKVICYTYTSSGTHIGTTSVNITLNVPSYTPTITSITLTGNSLLSSAYVKGKSTVTVNATVGTSYGASTKSIITVIDDKSYSGLPFTTSVLSSGSKTAQITFVDSRDKSVTVTSSAITVYDYSIPNITEFTFARQSDGTTVIATVKGSISAINNKNAKTVKVTLNGVTNTVTSSSYTINATTTFTSVPTDQTLTGKVVFTDSYTTVERAATLPTVAVTMDFYKDGNGIAMGKVAEEGNLLDVAWAANIGGDFTAKKNATIAGSATITGSATIKGGAAITGNASISGDLTVGGKNLLDYAKSKHSWGKNTVLYNAQTVANTYGATLNGASVTLEANSTYLVLVGVMASDGAQASFSDILLANVETGGEALISCSGRSGAYAGGGISGFAVVKTTSSTTFARCQSYGYKNASFNLYMRTVAIKLDT